jgi:hypothetical protein
MQSLESEEYIWDKNPTCLRLALQVMFFATSFALLKAGSSILARIAIIAITTRSSMRVKYFFNENISLVRIFKFSFLMTSSLF